jgi:hypothetical protein
MEKKDNSNPVRNGEDKRATRKRLVETEKKQPPPPNNKRIVKSYILYIMTYLQKVLSSDQPFLFVVLGIKPRASHMVGKHSTTGK